MNSSVLLNGAMGLGITVSALFCMGSIGSILSSQFSYPFVQIFANATKSNGDATAMVSILVDQVLSDCIDRGQTAILLIVAISGSMGLVATSSRMLWAFAREGGIPGSNTVAYVSQRSALPLHAIGLTATINCLIALISLGSEAAFNAFTGLTIAGFYSSFMIAGSVMLYKRLTTPAEDIMWGPFRL